MAWVAGAVAMGGASLIGGYLSSQAAGRAADAQAGASQYAADLQYKMYKQNRKDQEPWRQAGVKALSGLDNQDFQRDFSMTDFQADPGYAFRLAEGQKAIDRAAAARGMGNSGATMKALANYGQNMASSEYQNAYNRFNNDRTNRFNRLSSIAGFGQTATNQLGQAGQNFANMAGEAAMSGANARASGIMGQANAINSTIGGLANTWMDYQLMKKKQG